jgi:hypothetical protein
VTERQEWSVVYTARIDNRLIQTRTIMSFIGSQEDAEAVAAVCNRWHKHEVPTVQEDFIALPSWQAPL